MRAWPRTWGAERALTIGQGAPESLAPLESGIHSPHDTTTRRFRGLHTQNNVGFNRSAMYTAYSLLAGSPMYVRDFTFGDEPALQAVFYSAVHTTAASDCTPAQMDAWAPDRPDMERWTVQMRAIRPFVVEEEGRIVGYADLQVNGYIDHFYVSGTNARRGVGRILMDRIHTRAQELKLTRLFSDVSRTAQPFFKRFGFLVLEHKTVVVGGVSLPNALMTKDLLTGGEKTG